MDNPTLTPTTIPLALYVHIPWCERKCPYCDFNSHALSETLPEQQYIDALSADLELDLKENQHHIGQRKVQTIFIGGGTPSLLSAAAIERLLRTIERIVPWETSAEVTVEANPGSADRGKFQGYLDAGVTRLSLGVQSFNDRYLPALGRVHNGKDALRAIEAAQLAGFAELNLDLMFGLPQQNMADAVADIERAIACAPAHISSYQLTIEPNTWFYQHPPPLPADDLIGDMQQQIAEKLAQHRYQQYEVSAYARDDRLCRHNLNYWRFGDYLGIGAGAHGKISGHSGIIRSWKVKHPRRYLQLADSGQRIGGRHELDDDTVVLEFMLNALRLRERISNQMFSGRTGLSLQYVITKLIAAKNDGLLDWDEEGFRASERGYRYLNSLLDRFVPETKDNASVNAG